jgi:hypothetical protein
MVKVVGMNTSPANRIAGDSAVERSADVKCQSSSLSKKEEMTTPQAES